MASKKTSAFQILENRKASFKKLKAAAKTLPIDQVLSFHQSYFSRNWPDNINFKLVNSGIYAENSKSLSCYLCKYSFGLKTFAGISNGSGMARFPFLWPF